MNPKLKKLAIPVVAVFAGLVLGAIIMLCIQANPIYGYEDMFTGALGSPRALGQTVQSMGPLILTALAFAVTMKSGLFNIGMSGQALAGWFCSFWFALSFPNLPAIIMIPAVVIVGMLAGAVMGFIPGLLRALLGTSEVITTIMLNYIIMYFTTFFLSTFSPKILNSSSSSQTKTVPTSAQFMPNWLYNLTGQSTLSLWFLFAILAIVIMQIVMKRTTFGFEIKAVGLNANASDYAGISAKRTIIVSMIVSGVLAGLGGVLYGMGLSGAPNFVQQSATLDVGFNGMVVALLAENSPVGIFFAALLFSILQNGAPNMSNMDNIPTQITQIVTAAIIFFVAIKFVIERLLPAARERRAKVKKEEESAQ